MKKKFYVTVVWTRKNRTSKATRNIFFIIDFDYNEEITTESIQNKVEEKVKEIIKNERLVVLNSHCHITNFIQIH
jgi:hypothetical protein